MADTLKNNPSSHEQLSFAPPKAMSVYASFSQFLSTAWAAKIAWKWFLTPYPFKIPKRELPFEVRFGAPELFTHENGLKFPVYRLGTGTKHLLLVHGWAGRFSQFHMLMDFIEQKYPDLLKEYTLTGFNAVAHRGAEGKSTMMPEIGTCIAQITSRYGPADLLIAHSIGCNAAMHATAQSGAVIHKQVLISPPGRISDMVRIFCSALGFNDKVKARIVVNLKQSFGENFDSFSAPELAPKNTIPTLVIHDTDDRDTPISMGREVGQNMNNGTYIETSGLGHRRILRDARLAEQIYDWSFNES